LVFLNLLVGKNLGDFARGWQLTGHAGQNLDFIANLIDFQSQYDAVAAFGDIGDCAFEIANHRVNNTPLFVFIKLGYDAADFLEANICAIPYPSGTPAGR
jgi:hypothetical protein